MRLTDGVQLHVLGLCICPDPRLLRLEAHPLACVADRRLGGPTSGSSIHARVVSLPSCWLCGGWFITSEILEKYDISQYLVSLIS